MKIYQVDTKETVWHRSEYEVEDNVTPEQLFQMIEQNEIEPDYVEGYLYETAEQITVNENGGDSTVEIMENLPKQGWQVVWGNGKNYSYEEK